jgi:hypothetical protein
VRRFLASVRGRLRHGQAVQEVLDRLAARGLVVYPYLVFEERADHALAAAPRVEGLRARRLTDADLPQLEAIAQAVRSERSAAVRLGRGETGVGAFDGERLVAYTWCDLVNLGGFGRGTVLRRLAPDEACLAKSWTMPEYRGRGIVLFLRREMYAAMQALGKRRLCSACLYFNGSVRRVKAKVGAEAVELRLALRLPGGFKRDLLLKRYPRPAG